MVKRRFLSTRMLENGMVIDQSIIDKSGRILVARKTVLDDYMIDALRKMKISGVYIREGEEDENEEAGPLRLGELTLLAIATSIDALAVGITFAFLGVNIVSAISIIGCTTFVLSGAGVMVGHRFGLRYKKKAEIAGGVILILIGVKILLEHLGILA